MAYVISAAHRPQDETVREVAPGRAAKGFSNDALWALLGGYYEPVRLPNASVVVVGSTTVLLPDRSVLLVDEDGRLKGRTRNWAGSALVGYEIVGDVLIATVRELGWPR